MTLPPNPRQSLVEKATGLELNGPVTLPPGSRGPRKDGLGAVVVDDVFGTVVAAAPLGKLPASVLDPTARTSVAIKGNVMERMLISFQFLRLKVGLGATGSRAGPDGFRSFA